MSKGAMWAAAAVVLAMVLMILGQWPLALAVAVLGGAGYVAARSVEDAVANRECAGASS